jgi:hypothetical protein
MTLETIRSTVMRRFRLLPMVFLALAALLLPASPTWAQG